MSRFWVAAQRQSSREDGRMPRMPPNWSLELAKSGIERDNFYGKTSLVATWEGDMRQLGFFIERDAPRESDWSVLSTGCTGAIQIKHRWASGLGCQSQGAVLSSTGRRCKKGREKKERRGGGRERRRGGGEVENGRDRRRKKQRRDGGRESRETKEEEEGDCLPDVICVQAPVGAVSLALRRPRRVTCPTSVG